MEPLRRWIGLRPWQRHGLVLMVAGAAYIFVGISFFSSDPTRKDQLRSLAIALRWMPLRNWGIVFIVVGTMGIISARWPPISDTWGYTALTGLSAGWGAVYAMGYLFYNAPVTAISGAVIWNLMAFMWWAVSGLVNPIPLAAVIVDESG